MRHKGAFWLTLLLLYFQAGTSAVQLNGVLGESVTFQIKESKPFAIISWSRTERNGRFKTLALVAPRKPCQLLIPLAAFKERVISTEDCRNLRLSHLGQEDMKRYTANIVLTTSESIDEHFDLKVYKRLQRKDLSVKCTINRGRTKLLQLNCSAEGWKDQLELQWFVAEEIMSQVTRENLLTVNYTNQEVFDQEVSCKAKNPVSKVSKTMTLREACPRHQRYMNIIEVVSRLIPVGLSMFAGIVVLFILLLSKRLARHQRIPAPPLPITAQAARPNAESPPAPLQQPPGWEG